MEGIDTVPGHVLPPDGGHDVPRQTAKDGGAAAMQ